MNDFDLLKSEKYWKRLSEQVSKEIDDLKCKNKKLKELLKEYRYQNSCNGEVDFCIGCGTRDYMECKPDCEIKKALE